MALSGVTRIIPARCLEGSRHLKRNIRWLPFYGVLLGPIPFWATWRSPTRHCGERQECCNSHLACINLFHHISELVHRIASAALSSCALVAHRVMAIAAATFSPATSSGVLQAVAAPSLETRISQWRRFWSVPALVFAVEPPAHVLCSSTCSCSAASGYCRSSRCGRRPLYRGGSIACAAHRLGPALSTQRSPRYNSSTRPTSHWAGRRLVFGHSSTSASHLQSSSTVISVS